jgi:hypothetical protein
VPDGCRTISISACVGKMQFWMYTVEIMLTGSKSTHAGWPLEYVFTLNSIKITQSAQKLLMGRELNIPSQNYGCLEQWYSTFFVRVPPDIISL